MGTGGWILVSLLDTNIVSQPLKPAPHAAANAWLLATPREMTFLSVITLKETRAGIELLKDPIRKEALETWYGRTKRRYSSRIIPVNEEIAEISGKFTAQLRRKNHPADPHDVLLGATAFVHGMQVVTLNRKDFEPMESLGVAVLHF